MSTLNIISGIVLTPMPYIGGYLWVNMNPEFAMSTSIVFMFVSIFAFYILLKPYAK